MSTADRTIALRGFGRDLLTRDQGAEVRSFIKKELGSIDTAKRVVIYFDGVDAITPSFADECLGKLLMELGKDRFRELVSLRATNAMVRTLVNRVLSVRVAELAKSRKPR